MEPKAWRKVTTITSLMLLLVVLPLLSACGSTAVNEPAVERTAAEEAGIAVASTCITCHNNEDLLKETAAPIEEEPEEPSGEG